jgi:hypothetical protein
MRPVEALRRRLGPCGEASVYQRVYERVYQLGGV